MSGAGRTMCPYCGVGCGLLAEVDGGRLVSVAGDPVHPVNRGRTCQKPVHLPAAVHAPDRATTPLLRERRDARWRESTWEEVMPSLAGRLREIQRRHGRDAIAFYISGQLLTEDYYAINKLAKGFLGTNNVDSNSRLCMSSAVAGYRETFGADGPPPAYADLDQADCVLLLGTNTAACHPIVWGRIRDRGREGATVIVADPRRTDTAAAADVHLAVRPGSDLALLNAMLHVIACEGLIDEAFVARRTEGIEAALAAASEWPPERAAEACGVPAEAIADAARRFARAPRAMALWSMGANQSTVGTLKNRALHNLCLATGNLGRPGTGPLSLTGQPNAMGGRESGGLAQLLPGYRSVQSEQDRAEMERLWALPPGAAGISPRVGHTATELIEALEDGRVRAVWICATNPVVSMPDGDRVRAALERAELVVVQDAYHPTETGALADVVLPAAQWPEKEGTMTNSERRIGLVRALLEPPGSALPDWEIFARLARELGHGPWFAWESAAEVYAEFAATTAGRPCDQSGVSHARLRREGGVQWPCPAEGPEGEGHPGTVRLYADGPFHTSSGRARFAPTPHSGPAEAADADFPLVLTTGRVADQWHTMTRTGKAAALRQGEPEPFVELHPDDARAASVRDGERVRVRSVRGAAMMRARVTASIARGAAFAPFHWGALHAPPGAGALNAVTSAASDPVSKQPELKACAARVEPLGVRPAASPPRGGRRLVVVGSGMAAMATVEAALAHRPGGDWNVTVVGREPEPPYNRVLLSSVLAGVADEDELELRPAAWLAERGIELRTGTDVIALDLDGRAAVLAGGERLDYDALVLATGSQPALPPIAGLDRPGVHAFRTLADVRAIQSDARRARRAVVVGGGPLGLEAARGLGSRGLHVTVVHLADRLMETQLDQLSAALLERVMRRLGLTVLRDRLTEEVVGEQHVEGVRLAGGELLPADLVVVATGIRPEVELARASGIEVGRGVLVDDELRTSAPGVWAVGECAEHRGVVYGLWAPLAEQARAAGASIAGDPAAFLGAVPTTTLKVMGVDLFCAGAPAATGPQDEVVSMDTRSARYRKLVIEDGRLAGAILLGDVSEAPLLHELLRDRTLVPEALLEAPAAGGDATAALDGNALVCTCAAVRRDAILAAIRDQGFERADQVATATGASTGCGSCRGAVAALVAEANAEREEELRAGRGRVAAAASPRPRARGADTSVCAAPTAHD